MKHPTTPQREELEYLASRFVIAVRNAVLLEDISGEPALHALDSIGVFTVVRAPDRRSIFEVRRH